MTDSETVGKCPCGSCAFKLRHYTAFRRLPLLCALAWAEAVGCESSSSDMSGAFSSCCGEYRSVPADSRTVVPIKAANSVHTPLLYRQNRSKVVRFCTTFNEICLDQSKKQLFAQTVVRNFIAYAHDMAVAF